MNTQQSLFINVRAWVLILCSTILISACGGGGGSGGGSTTSGGTGSSDEGEVIIGLTDAEGDFLSYTIDVLSVKLTHQNGSEVETLPLSTRVDFAEYTEVTEFLTAATVPNGIYTQASILVDYSNAEIVVEDASGDPVDAFAVNENGDPLAALELSVELSTSDTFRVAPGIPAHITLDFDLEASNSADLALTPAEVTVRPILIADTVLEDPKPHRLRGLLNEVAVDENVFSIFIRPFYRHNGNFGSIRVHVNDDTEYEIDGEVFSGTPGLEALDLQPERAPIVARGRLDRDNRQFLATEVLAGTSVPWGDKDIVNGNVVARSGDTLTLSRVRHSRDDNHRRFHRLLTVELGTNTAVVKQGHGDEAVNKDDISVGQHIRVTGEFSPTVDIPVLDASDGRVRMLYTDLRGSVTNPIPLAVDLQSIDRRRISVFDFSGTGASEDADPDYYEVATGTLSLLGIDLGEPVQVRGHVRPFGIAPEDFDAQTVVALGDLPAKLLVSWEGSGTVAPFETINDTGLVIDLDGTGLGKFHTVYQAGIATDLTTLSMNPSLVPNSSGTGLFTLAYNGRTRQFVNFARFSAALSDTLDGVNTLQGLHARGEFDADSVTLTLRGMVARVLAADGNDGV